MTWVIRNPAGTTVLDSTNDYGIYLLDQQVRTGSRGTTHTYDYSTRASRIYPMVIPNGGSNNGGVDIFVNSRRSRKQVGNIPSLRNWTGPTDTTFTVSWESTGIQVSGQIIRGGGIDFTGVYTDASADFASDTGYTLLVFAESETTAGPLAWRNDAGGRSVIGPDGAPPRFIGSVNKSYSRFETPSFMINSFINIQGERLYDFATFQSPDDSSGLQVALDYQFPLLRMQNGVQQGLSFNASTTGRTTWRHYYPPGAGPSTNNLYFFSTRWPAQNLTGNPYMRMREQNSPNRIFFDSRTPYMRVLDVQFTTYGSPTSYREERGTNSIGGRNYPLYRIPTSYNSSSVTFDSSRIPDVNNFGVFSNVQSGRDTSPDPGVTVALAGFPGISLPLGPINYFRRDGLRFTGTSMQRAPGDIMVVIAADTRGL